ncbi:hypothetical protein HYW44_02570 [Candidatus Daviesbacteria bacterium]|nr:hypothetical protein [Candidatus Daviesbacteria bacterium]
MPEYEVMHAPIVLGDNQNFFDQPPFYNLTEVVASEVGIDVWRVKSQINHACFEYGGKVFARNESSWYQHPSQKISRLMMEFHEPFTTKALLRLRSARTVDPGVFLDSFRLLGQGLEKYPHWAEYVVTQKPPDYSPAGNRKEGEEGFLYVESYPSWVMRRLVKTRLNQLRRDFPEFFCADSYLETPNISSPRPILRWTIPLEEQGVALIL